MQTKLANQNHTASDENFQLMSRWLSDCTSSHRCSAWSKANRQGSWMPARLIDVHALRLVVTAELEKDVEYLTLSHCWGTRRPAQTLTHNYEQLKLGIPLDMINSVTYQEAFIITRRLGFQYIWIDSLCILQDDAQDWQIEAAHMSEVYGHSLLNLIAAHAKDDREGCFADRNILTVRPGKIKNPFNPLSDDAFLVYPVRLERIYEEQVRASPVYKRAWILQERLLSARTLYFGREQLVWACGELEACEAFPNGADYISSRPHSQSFVDKQAVQLLLSNAVAPMANRSQRLSESWARVIKMYTSAHMTYERDKLVALQGIAARAQEHIGGRYLAGLWDNNERNLLWSLLWFADPSDRNRRRNREYIGPTWSWVSLSGRIEMSTPDPSWRHRISQPILSVNYEPVWPAKVKIISATAEAPYQPYGQVTGGFLTVRGILKKTEMRIITEDDIFAYEFFDAEIYGSRGSGNGVSSQALCSCHLDIPSASEGVLPVICLPFIAEKEKRQGRFSGHSRVHGLLLEAAGRARREYFRIGYFTSSPRRDEEWAAWLVGLEEQTITIL
jgi:Heterokaryon incompatibility protein (HET)